MPYHGDSFSEESYDGDDDHEEDVSAVCSACERVFERGDNWRANNHNMEQHRQTHFMACPWDCGEDIFDRQANKFAMRAALQRHIAEVHGNTSATCPTCQAVFDKGPNRRANENSLKEHMQVHEPRSVCCPLCGEQRFRSPINAVQHVESGSCPSCPGREAARRGIYSFIARNQVTQQMLATQPQLHHSSSRRGGGEVPEQPYQCTSCARTFASLSAMLQHQASKHRHAVAYLGRLAIG